ncbi:MAG: P-type conjugative transfer protein TrbG [Candidatus Rokuibacteriota bacterium]|nr:MAG: P-type conjugative transfer protein TrbG [Candidatus Rokubacteria bacterium]
MRSRDRRHLVLGLVALGSSCLVGTGCLPLGQTGAAPADLARAVPLGEPAGDPAPAPVPATAELVGPDDQEILAAMQAWKAEGRAPIIRRDDFIQYPYGLTEAVVSCQPLRVCDIELEAGEEILQVSLGDGSRWLASPAFSGERESLTPHVLVKPTELGIATNAVITTTRRTYYLGLVSRRDATQVRRVKFYYPQELVEQANDVFRAKAAQRKQDRETTIARLRSPAVDSLNFDYEISGDAVPWRPVRVFDDGAHVYIQMPPAMRVTEAPALLVRTRTGEGALVNYRLRQPYYVVDTLFETALLVMGVGTHQERVTIRRLGPPTLGGGQ